MSETRTRPLGGTQTEWLSSLERGPHTSGLSAEDRRCLGSLLRRGLVAHPREWRWEITDAGREALHEAPRLPYRPRR